jgi:hypothetical protein
MKSAVVSGMIGFGIVLFLLSALWSTIFPATATWTNEKANRFGEVKARLHNLSFIVNVPKPNLQKGQDLGQLKAEYEQLKKENEQLDVEFTSAADTPKTVSRFLKWTGLSLAGVGIIGYYAVNQSR